MYMKFSRALLFLLTITISVPSFAASSFVVMNGDAHVGEQAVLSVETSQIPPNGSVEWSVSPTTGQNPDRISLRSGGRECAFTPLDTHPVKVIASLADRSGNIISTNEILVTPKEFLIDISVVIEKPLELWDSSKRSDYAVPILSWLILLSG